MHHYHACVRPQGMAVAHLLPCRGRLISLRLRGGGLVLLSSSIAIPRLGALTVGRRARLACVSHKAVLRGVQGRGRYIHVCPDRRTRPQLPWLHDTNTSHLAVALRQ